MIWSPAPISLSTLGLSKEALSTGARVMGSFLTTSNMSNLVDHLSQVGGKAFVELLYYSTEHPWGHSRMNSTLLECHGQCNHFFMLHHSIILNSLELILVEYSLFTPTHPDGAEWTASHLFPAMWLAPWRLQLDSRPSLWLWHCWSTHPYSGEEIGNLHHSGTLSFFCR